MYELFKNILDDLPSGVWVTDSDDRVTYINKAMTLIAGASAEKFTGLYVFKDLDKPGNKEFLESYRKVKKNLFPGEYEVRLKDSEGKGFVHRGWLTPIVRNGSFEGMIVTAEDITEKDIFEEALKDSEEKFRRTIEFAADGILLGSHEGFIIEANQAACELFGMSKNEMLNLHISKMPFTKESLEISPMRFDLLKEGKTVISERAILRKNGTEIIIEMKTKMMDDGTYQSIYRDITERKRIEKELKENEEKYRTLFEESNDAIYLMEGDTFIECNDQAVKMFNCDSIDDMVNHKPMEFSPTVQPDGRSTNDSALEHIDAALAGNPQRFYWKHSKKDGSLFDAEVSLNRLVLNEKMYLQAIVRDVTFRMETEKEIKSINESLEEKVKERTCQLEEANRELESFSYSVSHDLRAPVRHIAGFTEILKKNLGSDPDKSSEPALEKIKKSTEKMERLIDDLLKFSKTGRLELSKNKTDMNLMIESVKKEFCDNTPDRNIKWNISVLPAIYCDKSLLKIVWENLICNACKYTTGKDAQIEIGFYDSEEEVEFYIKDNGIGFDPKFSNKLFGVFQRLHQEKDFPGTGIGLATVKRIILRHDGAVKAESEGEGKGATFYFTLPKNGEHLER